MKREIKNLRIRKAFLAFVGIIFWVSIGHSQDTAQLLGEVAKVYTGSNGTSSNHLIAGFSIAGLIGGFLFSGIGFIAFMYGRKNEEFRPMILGLVLMVYPYFFKGTMALYLVGIVLTLILFFWRE